MKKPVSISIEEGTVNEIDDLRGMVPRSRIMEMLLNRGIVEVKRDGNNVQKTD